MDYRKGDNIYSSETPPKYRTGFHWGFQNQSEIVFLLLKNKRNVKIIPLWLHNTKLEVRNVCLS